MKGKLGGLGATVERHIASARLRIEHRRAEAALRERDRRRAAELLSLAETSMAINAAGNLDQLMRIGTDRAASIVGARIAVTSLTVDVQTWAQSNAAVFVASGIGIASAEVRPAAFGIHRSVCANNYTMRIPPTDPAVEREALGRIDRYSSLAGRGCLAAPLLRRDGKNLGLIQLGDKDAGEFSAEDESVLVQIAQVLSIAIENMRLFEETRRACEEAKLSNKMKDEFLATLSHELRTPLNAIIGNAELLTLEQPGSADFNDCVETIKRNALAQNTLISELLDVSRIITGKLALNITTLDLAPIMRAALASSKFAAAAKGVQLDLQIEADVPPVLGDGERLQQVLWNLLSNAVKFTPRGGCVTARLQHELSMVHVVVTDSGEGIDPAFLPFAFERFRQEDASMSRRYGGLGLGLAIVRHIVELHGGAVQVASAGKGQGATFTVWLPPLAVREAGQVLAARHRPVVNELVDNLGALADAPTYDLSGIHVLTVDDHKDARDMVAKVLRRAQASVELAATAEEALFLAKTGRFDVFIFDIGMPHEDGIALIQKIRALAGKVAQTPAIALTAYVRAEDQALTASSGYQMHLAKPVLPSMLVRSVARLGRC